CYACVRFFVCSWHLALRVLLSFSTRRSSDLEVSGGYEQGLLSLAFHPRFEENRTFFVYYTDRQGTVRVVRFRAFPDRYAADPSRDRKSTRLNSSHVKISYAVFSLKKKTTGDR